MSDQQQHRRESNGEVQQLQSVQETVHPPSHPTSNTDQFNQQASQFIDQPMGQSTDIGDVVRQSLILTDVPDTREGIADVSQSEVFQIHDELDDIIAYPPSSSTTTHLQNSIENSNTTSDVLQDYERHRQALNQRRGIGSEYPSHSHSTLACHQQPSSFEQSSFNQDNNGVENSVQVSPMVDYLPSSSNFGHLQTTRESCTDLPCQNRPFHANNEQFLQRMHPITSNLNGTNNQTIHDVFAAANNNSSSRQANPDRSIYNYDISIDTYAYTTNATDNNNVAANGSSTIQDDQCWQPVAATGYQNNESSTDHLSNNQVIPGNKYSGTSANTNGSNGIQYDNIDYTNITTISTSNSVPQGNFNNAAYAVINNADMDQNDINGRHTIQGEADPYFPNYEALIEQESRQYFYNQSDQIYTENQPFTSRMDIDNQETMAMASSHPNTLGSNQPTNNFNTNQCWEPVVNEYQNNDATYVYSSNNQVSHNSYEVDRPHTGAIQPVNARSVSVIDNSSIQGSYLNQIYQPVADTSYTAFGNDNRVTTTFNADARVHGPVVNRNFDQRGYIETAAALAHQILISRTNGHTVPVPTTANWSRASTISNHHAFNGQPNGYQLPVPATANWSRASTISNHHAFNGQPNRYHLPVHAPANGHGALALSSQYVLSGQLYGSHLHVSATANGSRDLALPEQHALNGQTNGSYLLTPDTTNGSRTLTIPNQHTLNGQPDGSYQPVPATANGSHALALPEQDGLNGQPNTHQSPLDDVRRSHELAIPQSQRQQPQTRNRRRNQSPDGLTRSERIEQRIAELPPIEVSQIEAAFREANRILQQRIQQNRSTATIPSVELWQFLLEELMDPTKRGDISWIGRDGSFRIINTSDVPRRWGARKRRPRMNYEKMSRGLRYYYGRSLVVKSPNRLYGYRFTSAVLSYIERLLRPGRRRSPESQSSDSE